MTDPMHPPIEVFVSYSHRDEELRRELDQHLALLRRQGYISVWHDRRISAGTEWKDAIDAHLNSAGLILLLISSDFIASDYCYDIELQRALERHERGEARVIPIILRACDWQSAPFGRLQALPKDGQPAMDRKAWATADDAWLDVARGLRLVAQESARRGAPMGGSSLPAEREPLADWLAAIRERARLPQANPPAASGNPFYVGGAVQAGGRFVGRDDDLALLVEDARKGQHLSLVGERRIGKTSLLWELYLQRRTLLPGYLVGYLDLLACTCRTRGGFYSAALRALFADCADPAALAPLAAQGLPTLADDEALDANGFDLWARRLCALDPRRRPVLLLDEFEQFLEKPAEFDKDFYDGLRALGNAGQVAFVVASHQPLKDLLTIEGQLTSDFPNIFNQRVLEVLGAKEAHDLVSQPSDRPLTLAEAELAKRLGRGYPHLLQAACREIYRAQGGRGPDLALAERRFYEAAANMWPRSLPRPEPRPPRRVWQTVAAGLVAIPAALGRLVLWVRDHQKKVIETALGLALVALVMLVILGAVKPDAVFDLLRKLLGLK